MHSAETVALPDEHARNRPFPAPGAALAPRQQWIDALRGFGIVVVVVGHAAGGMLDSPSTGAKEWFRPLFATIYTFHMPLFFFLSGLFVTGRLERDPARFRARLMPDLVWPYILWSSLQVSVIWAAGSLVNNSVENLGDVLIALAWAPPSQFWFLYALFLFHLASSVIAPRVSGNVFLLCAFGAASLAQLDFIPPVPEVILRMVPYYAIGVVLGPELVSGTKRTRLSRGGVMLFVAAAASVVVALYNAISKGEPGRWPATASEIVSDVMGFQTFFAAALMVAALVVVAQRFEGASPGWLRRLGQISMPIFLMHILFIAGTRIALPRLVGPIDGNLLLGILCVVGVAGPAVAYAVAKRLRIERVLGF